MIKLEETETKYLLSIPKAQRERAKKIRPRFWHNHWKRWVYPREPEVFEALITEFGEEATVMDITHPEASPTAALIEENTSLRAQLDEIQSDYNIIRENQVLKPATVPKSGPNPRMI